MAKRSKAYDAVVKARTILVVSQPFFGCLALHLNVIEVDEHTHPGLDTMAVDGVNMYLYAPFVNKLTEKELQAVVAHEVMHCAYKHFARRGKRNPIIWNAAGDFVINADLRAAGFTLPNPHLYDAKYDKMSTEEVYERIYQDFKKKYGDGKGDKDGKGQKIDVGGCGGVIDMKPQQGADKADAEAAAREWEANVRMAINVARAHNAGKLPAHLERLAEEMKKPRVDWRERTRDFIDQSMTKDFSWQRPNRRFAGSGLILPGTIPDALQHLVMCIDTSGSISGPLLVSMVNEGAGALDMGVADKLTLIYADAAVQRVEEYFQGDLVKPNPKGGGGTDFQDTFQWIKHNAQDASCVVYLTDMMTSSFGEDPGVPTLWAAYIPESYLASIKIPFGEVVTVDGAGE